jgi:hypothetical protein
VRRLVSDAVQVKPPLDAAAILLDEAVDPAARLRAHLPTEAEVRDAAQKLARQLKDTIDARTAGQEGWSIGDMAVTLVELDMGEVAMRGAVIIERPDA